MINEVKHILPASLEKNISEFNKHLSITNKVMEKFDHILKIEQKAIQSLNLTNKFRKFDESERFLSVNLEIPEKSENFSNAFPDSVFASYNTLSENLRSNLSIADSGYQELSTFDCDLQFDFQNIYSESSLAFKELEEAAQFAGETARQSLLYSENFSLDEISEILKSSHIKLEHVSQLYKTSKDEYYLARIHQIKRESILKLSQVLEDRNRKIRKILSALKKELWIHIKHLDLRNIHRKIIRFLFKNMDDESDSAFALFDEVKKFNNSVMLKSFSNEKFRRINTV